MTLKLGTFKVKVTDKCSDRNNSWWSTGIYIWFVKELFTYWPWSRYHEVKRRLHIWPWNLEPSRSRSQTRSQWKQLMKVYLHLMCERVIDHGLGTMKLNANNRFDLETWNLQGQGHRQRSQWVELIKVYMYLHVKFERGIVNGHSAMNWNARAKPNCWRRRTDRRTAPFYRLDPAKNHGH